MIKGVNLGSGNKWNCPGWRALDSIHGERLSESTRFDLDDASVQSAFSCHFFEHVDDATANNLFREVRRILRSDGVFRIVVPDVEKFIQKYKENDAKWYREVVQFNGRPEWSRYGVERTIDNLLLHFLANFDFNGPNGFYRGGPIGLDPKKLRHQAQTQTTGEFCNWVLAHVPQNDARVTPQHINWWTYEKFNQLLRDAGFRDIKRSEYMQTESENMKSGRFDSEKPQRRFFSLYVEAKK